MFFDRYFGIEGHIWMSGALRGYELDTERAKWVNLVRLYYPEIFILAVLKCKKKLWKKTTRNIDALILSLCKKIGFDISKANAIAFYVQHTLDLKEPITNKITESSDFQYYLQEGLFSTHFDQYKAFRTKMLNLLEKYDINPNNLNFSNFL